MLTKILFTVIVVLVVAVVFRHKNSQQAISKQTAKPVLKNATNDDGIKPKTIIYAILGLMIVVSLLIFTIHWQNQHQIINIQVSDSTGNTTHYQAYQKSIKGRKFETLDGIQVTLGDSDRMEMNSTD